ncbi:MAG: COX15/CtaA family protein [Novosphingobium sp.]|nr:COX15/CtaA family protein [Novosphingobium sp.]
MKARPAHLIGTRDDTPAIARWLLAVAGLVCLILVVGGITRLTESGLSITEWKPVTGVIPPLSEAAWQREFEAYKQIPQYVEVNGPAGMTLAQYKFIYFWEWVHRLLARLAGVAFALPLAVFWMRRTIPGGYKPRLLALLALGGLQGAVGWWMVTSGLSADVKVSHIRLATHLGVALITLGALVWTALDVLGVREGRASARSSPLGALAIGTVAVQVLFGALVAGMRAGYVAGAGWFRADAWPLMQGSFFPDGIDWSQGALHALFNDPFLVHFIHRWWAFVVVAVLVVLSRRVRALGRRDVSIAIHTAFGVQILLGISTIWSGMELWLAVLHQFTGALVVAATVWGAHVAGRRDGRAVDA